MNGYFTGRIDERMAEMMEPASTSGSKLPASVLMGMEFKGTFVGGSRRIDDFIPKCRGELKAKKAQQPAKPTVMASYEFVPEAREDEDVVLMRDHEDEHWLADDEAAYDDFEDADAAIDAAWAAKRTGRKTDPGAPKFKHVIGEIETHIAAEIARSPLDLVEIYENARDKKGTGSFDMQKLLALPRIVAMLVKEGVYTRRRFEEFRRGRHTALQIMQMYAAECVIAREIVETIVPTKPKFTPRGQMVANFRQHGVAAVAREMARAVNGTREIFREAIRQIAIEGDQHYPAVRNWLAQTAKHNPFAQSVFDSIRALEN